MADCGSCKGRRRCELHTGKTRNHTTFLYIVDVYTLQKATHILLRGKACKITTSMEEISYFNTTRYSEKNVRIFTEVSMVKQQKNDRTHSMPTKNKQIFSLNIFAQNGQTSANYKPVMRCKRMIASTSTLDSKLVNTLQQLRNEQNTTTLLR